MSIRIGIVNDFARRDASRYPFGRALESVGASWVPLHVSNFTMRWASPIGSDLRYHDDTSHGDDDPMPSLDAVLWRVSENHTARYEHLLRVIAQRYKVVNPYATILNCSDKWTTYQTLEKAGVPTVQTQLLLPGGKVPDLGTPLTVVKPNSGAGGRGVVARLPGETLSSDEVHVAQPMLSAPSSEHIRVLVCGGTAVAAMHRIPPIERRGHIDVNNIDSGGLALRAELEPHVAALAIEAADLMQGSVLGIDLVPDHGKLRVLEVNSCPGIDGIATVADVDCYSLAAEVVIEEVLRDRSTDGIPSHLPIRVVTDQ